jgi:hypothetical protein
LETFGNRQTQTSRPDRTGPKEDDISRRHPWQIHPARRSGNLSKQLDLLIPTRGEGGRPKAGRVEASFLTRNRRTRLICPSCQCAADFFGCDAGQITGIFRASPARTRGVSRSSRTLSGRCGGRNSAQDECACRGRRSRVVLTPRRWRQAGRDACAWWPATVTKSPITGESTKETVKTIARGMPG